MLLFVALRYASSDYFWPSKLWTPTLVFMALIETLQLNFRRGINGKNGQEISRMGLGPGSNWLSPWGPVLYRHTLFWKLFHPDATNMCHLFWHSPNWHGFTTYAWLYCRQKICCRLWFSLRYWWVHVNSQKCESLQWGMFRNPVIQANGRLSFEDDLRSGGLL